MLEGSKSIIFFVRYIPSPINTLVQKSTKVFDVPKDLKSVARAQGIRDVDCKPQAQWDVGAGTALEHSLRRLGILLSFLL